MIDREISGVQEDVLSRRQGPSARDELGRGHVRAGNTQRHHLARDEGQDKLAGPQALPARHKALRKGPGGGIDDLRALAVLEAFSNAIL